MEKSCYFLPVEVHCTDYSTTLSLFFSVLPPLAALVYVRSIKAELQAKAYCLLPSHVCILILLIRYPRVERERERTLLLLSCVCLASGLSVLITTAHGHYLLSGHIGCLVASDFHGF